MVVFQVSLNFGLLVIGICSVKSQSNAPVMQRLSPPFLAGSLGASFHSNMMESSTTLAQPPIRKTAKPGVPMRLIGVSFACDTFFAHCLYSCVENYFYSFKDGVAVNGKWGDCSGEGCGLKGQSCKGSSFNYDGKCIKKKSKINGAIIG